MNETRLPRSGKEGFLYGGVICVVTCVIMMMLNIGTMNGHLYWDTWKSILMMLVPVWIIAMLLETFVWGRVGHALVEHFTDPEDGFNAHILFNILFVVTGMSASMTLIGGWLGGLMGGHLSLEPLLTFPEHWPRNFCVAFWCECLLAQPIARGVMKKMHAKQDRKKQDTAEQKMNKERVEYEG